MHAYKQFMILEQWNEKYFLHSSLIQRLSTVDLHKHVHLHKLKNNFCELYHINLTCNLLRINVVMFGTFFKKYHTQPLNWLFELVHQTSGFIVCSLASKDLTSLTFELATKFCNTRTLWSNLLHIRGTELTSLLSFITVWVLHTSLVSLNSNFMFSLWGVWLIHTECNMPGAALTL